MFLNKNLKPLMIFYKGNILKTPFGTITSDVSLFPIFYLIIVYISGLIPFQIWNGQTIYKLWSQQEYLAEHFQFVLYVSASLLSLANIFKNKYKVFSFQNLCWIFFFISVSFIAIEEVSYLVTYQEGIFKLIRLNSTQNEVNIHNLKIFYPYIHSGYILINLFLGWFAWRNFSNIEAIPDKIYSLYFLMTALAFTVLELKNYSKSIFVKSFPVLQESFEFLMALALFLHALKMFKYYSKR